VEPLVSALSWRGFAATFPRVSFLQSDYDDHPRAEPFAPAAVGWIVGATAVALALRLVGLGEWSVWVDEAHTWRDATMPFDEFAQSGRARYPVAFLLLRWFVEGVGGAISEGWLRLPFAVVGIVTVPLLAIVARPLVGVGAAVMSAWLLAVHPWHIFWSQNARAYVLVAFFAVACLGLAWTAWNRRSFLAWVWAALCAVLAGFSHPSGWVLVPICVAFGLLARFADADTFRSWRFWGLSAAAVVAVAAIVLIASELPVARYFVRAKPDPSLGHLLETTAFYFRVPFLLALLAGLCFLADAGRAQAVLLAAWVFLPGVGLGVFGALVVKTTARFGFLALPAVLMIAALGGVQMAALLREKVAGVRGAILAGVLPAMLFADALAYDYLYYGPEFGDRPRWREALTWVQNDAEGRPATVLSTNQPSTIFYLAPSAWARGGDTAPWEIGGLESFAHPDEGGPIGKVRSILDARAAFEPTKPGATPPAVYVLITRPELEEMDPDGEVYAFLRENLRLVAEYRSWVGPKDHTVLLFSHPEPVADDGGARDPDRPR